MLLTLLISCLPLIWGEELVIEPPNRVDMPPPEGSNILARNVQTAFVSMPIDHFDPQNNDTYLMVSFVNYLNLKN
jgi:hypothetical protein